MECTLKKIIFSNIICVLIDNYKGTEEYKEQQEEIELNEKKGICERNINNIDNLDLGLTIADIKNNDIDKIYSKILVFLIKNNKLEDYDYAYKLIKDLELESINYTINIIEEF